MAFFPVDVPYEAKAANDESPVVVVSLGDSYSSGEGIEEFYGQFKSGGSEVDWDDKSFKSDWLAHRSKHSWPSLLEIPGIDGTLSDYKVTGEGSNWSDKCRWYFAASSGAETIHYYEKQEKQTKKDVLARPIDHTLPPQLDVFDTVEINGDTVDYVTMTIGGNDVGFSDIVTDRVAGSFFTAPSIADLTYRICEIWDNWDNKYGANIKKAYLDTYDRAGSQAYILIAGYPQLLYQDITGYNLAEVETVLISQSITEFNRRLEALVDECNSERDTDHFVFVDVESAFSGHAAYSGKYNYALDDPNAEPDQDGPWINGVDFFANSEDLKHPAVSSSYSMHPNKRGAEAYARCVNAAIEKIETKKQKKLQNTNKKLDEEAEASGYKWLIKPNIEADTIISGEEDYYDKYSYIQKDGKYGIIDYDGNITVEPEYDGYDDDMVTDLGAPLAVYDSGSGFTVYSSGTTSDGIFGNPYWCKHLSGYYLNSYDHTVYGWNTPDVYFTKIDKNSDESFLVAETSFVPEKSPDGTRTVFPPELTVSDGWFLCDAQGNELTKRYKYYACPWTSGSGSETTCAFSDDGTVWYNYTWDGTCVSDYCAPVESNAPGTNWKTDDGRSIKGFPFCATEGYLAIKPDSEHGFYVDVVSQERIGFFDDVRPVHNGKAWVRFRDKWGVISVGEDVSSDAAANELFSQLPEEFVFSSGAGGWQTVMNISSDGSFTGHYSDTNFGETGDGYPNGTVYICDFKGQFNDVRKIDEYTYSMKLDSFSYDGSHPYIKDGVQYIYASPSGIDAETKDLMVYLPGKPIASIPEGFIEWLKVWITDKNISSLPSGVYGIDNGQAGFIGFSE